MNEQCSPVTTVHNVLCTWRAYVRKLTDNFAQTRYTRSAYVYLSLCKSEWAREDGKRRGVRWYTYHEVVLKRRRARSFAFC